MQVSRNFLEEVKNCEVALDVVQDAIRYQEYCSFRDNRTALTLVSNRSGDESETGGAATGDAVTGDEEKSNEQSNAESSIGQSTSSQAASSQDAIQNAVALAVEAVKAAAIEGSGSLLMMLELSCSSRK